jgi:hypothetical protein
MNVQSEGLNRFFDIDLLFISAINLAHNNISR